MGNNKNKRLNVSTLQFLILSLAVSLVSVPLVYATCVGIRQKNLEAEAETDVFATMNLKDYEGNSYTTAYFAGSKLTMINVWETTCSACIGEFPDLESVYQELDPNEVKLIGICGDLIDAEGNVKEKEFSDAREILSDSGVTFPQLIPDSKSSAFFHTVISGYPTTFFVDEKGNIIESTAGSKNADKWKETIREVLEKASRGDGNEE